MGPLEQEIEWWKLQAAAAGTDKLALVSWGIHAGLRIAKGQRAMTREESYLLLTVARILRAKIKNDIYAEREDDLLALNVVLAPFDPVATAAEIAADDSARGPDEQAF
jgi:hypothetical protein